MEEYYTTIIPKGTLLFRSAYSTHDIVGDFAGIPVKKKVNTFCIYPNFNVFFYPFPFVSESVSAHYDKTSIFVLNNDVKLINLILPSKYTRKDKSERKGGIITCNETRTYKCSESGLNYDPCIDFKKVKDKEIVGMIGIAKEDSQTLQRLITSKFSTHKQYNKYYKLYEDARGIYGVPEIVLHPHKTIEMSSHIEVIDDYVDFMIENINKFNYTLFHTYNKNNLEDIMKQLLNGTFTKGGAVYKVETSTETGFYQLMSATNTNISKPPKFTFYNMKEWEEILNKSFETKIEDWVNNNDTNEILTLNNFNLTSIPKLPPNLTKLSLRDNKISKLENLPLTLEYLDIGTNSIEVIENLPSSLNKLFLDDNNISNIENLPISLKSLTIDSNNIKKVKNLPSELEFLSIQNNLLNEIKNLPLSLKDLNINNNIIDKVENLPDSLENLYMSQCGITDIDKFPSNLETLDITFNDELKTAPKAPASLKTLIIDKSQLHLTDILDFNGTLKVRD